MALLFRLSALAAFLVAISAAVLPARAEEALSPAQKEAVEKIVRETILKNPELIMEALRELERKRVAAEEAEQQQAVIALADTLKHDPATPVAGDPEGDVTLVEFFDYNCGYCKRVFPTVRDLVKDDGNIRFVLKEFPILSEGSEVAARAALAAERQDRYFDMHVALMDYKGQVDEKAVMSVARELGLDLDKLRGDMDDPAISEAIQRNRQLAQSLGIRGTPAFVIGNTLVPGAVGRQRLEDLIAQARKDNEQG